MSLTIHNIVASGQFHDAVVDLNKVKISDKIIFVKNSDSVSVSPDSNAFAFKLKELEQTNPNVNFMLFYNGKYVISGTTSEKELYAVDEKVRKVLREVLG